MKKRVLIYRYKLGVRSEPFVITQARACRAWDVILHGYDYLNCSGFEELTALRKIYRKATLLEKCSRFFARLFWWPEPFLMRMVRTTNPDLLHAHFGTDGVDIFPIARCLNLPLVVTLHGYDITVAEHVWKSGSMGLVRKSYLDRLRRMASMGVKFICVSETIRARALEAGLPESSLVVSYMGVNAPELKNYIKPYAEKDIDVLFVGRLVEVKGLDVLIDSLNGSLGEGSGFTPRVVVMGDGPLKEPLKAKAIEIGVDNIIEFLSAAEQEVVFSLMSRAKVLCLPSKRAADGSEEALGLVLLEAQGMGVPVITSAAGGGSEAILDQVTGYRFAPGDTRALRKLLEAILSDRDKWQAMSVAGVQFVGERFDISRQVECLEKIYSTALRGGR